MTRKQLLYFGFGTLIFLGVLIRFGALRYGLPLDVFGDEFVHIATAFSFLNDMTLRATEAFSYVPSLMAVLLAPFFGIFGGIGILAGVFAGIDGFKEFAILNSTEFISGARFASALFGAGFLWVLFIFTRRILGEWPALIATLIAAFDFWLVHESQIGHLWMATVALVLF